MHTFPLTEWRMLQTLCRHSINGTSENGPIISYFSIIVRDDLNGTGTFISCIVDSRDYPQSLCLGLAF